MNNEPTQVQPQSNDNIQSNKKKLIWGLVCLFGPSVLIVFSIVIYAIVNFMSGTGTSTNEADVFTEPSVWERVSNIVLFLVGGLSVLTLFPGIIVGIILLATRKS